MGTPGPTPHYSPQAARARDARLALALVVFRRRFTRRRRLPRLASPAATSAVETCHPLQATRWSPPVVAFYQLNRADNSFHPANTQGDESKVTVLINDPLRLTLMVTEKMKFEVVCGATTAIVGVVGMKQYVPLWTA